MTLIRVTSRQLCDGAYYSLPPPLLAPRPGHRSGLSRPHRFSWRPQLLVPNSTNSHRSTRLWRLWRILGKMLGRTSHATAILGPELSTRLPGVKVLLVGAGGIGCELCMFYTLGPVCALLGYCFPLHNVILTSCMGYVLNLCRSEEYCPHGIRPHNTTRP